MAAAPIDPATTDPAVQAEILNELARRVRRLGQDLSALSDSLTELVAVAEGRPADGARDAGSRSFQP